MRHILRVSSGRGDAGSTGEVDAVTVTVSGKLGEPQTVVAAAYFARDNIFPNYPATG
jgi:hypothetical protein